MKKILIGLFLVSVLSFANNINHAETKNNKQKKVVANKNKVISKKINITSQRGTKIKAIFTAVQGKKNVPLVILVHGHGGDKSEGGAFDKLSKELSEKGIATLRMDFPGCGESEESFTENYLSNMVNDVQSSYEYILKNESIDKNRVGMLGYSMGGTVTSQLLEKNADFSGVVFLAPAIDDPDKIFNDMIFVDGGYEGYYYSAMENGYVDFTTHYGQKQKLSKEWFEDIKKYDKSSGIIGYEKEILVIRGENDEIINSEIPFFIKNISRRAKSIELIEIAGTDHSFGFYSNDTKIQDRVTKEVIDFFVKNLK